jgi:hypothetical protein
VVSPLYYKPKVRGPIPDEVFGFFDVPNPSSCTLALEYTQPLTEMSTRNLLGDKGQAGRSVRMTTSPQSVSEFSRNYESLDSLLTGIALPFTLVSLSVIPVLYVRE